MTLYLYKFIARDYVDSMARKLSTRKRPARDVHMLKEQLKIEDGVFDNRTMMFLAKVFTHNIVSKLDFLIAKGKEADVYVADAGTKVEKKYVVLKIFRIETSSFYKRVDYMLGDPRFDGIKISNLYNVVTTWCKKEYGNLKIAEMADVHAPKPYYFMGNILAMEFISNNDTPAQTLKNTIIKDPEKVLDMILLDMKKLYAAELVHSDMSEYNVLMKGSTPYLIDFGQAVVLNHPNASAFLKRDVYNITTYFSKKYGVERDQAEVLSAITGK